MNRYLASTEYIDWETPDILAMAKILAAGSTDAVEITRHCFEFVRDEVKHSRDYKLNPVTYKASDVLAHRTGYCYAKSHLLVALLRANRIPAGLCYQRLAITNLPTFCLHGLNAVYLEKFGWYRLDPRGNKAGVTSEFYPPIEKLPFPIVALGESDLPEIWPEPLPLVIGTLKRGKTYLEVANNLPDIPLISTNQVNQPGSQTNNF